MEWYQPFHYGYMRQAIVICGLVGGICGLMSAYLVLKGWSLVGDALSHAIVPGVAIAAFLGLPFSLGAIIAALLATITILFLELHTQLKQDTVIGLVYISFFAIGLFLVSLNPLMIDIQTIMLGNVLTITPQDSVQLFIVIVVVLVVVLLKWRDFVLCIFNAEHARVVGINSKRLKLLFFILLTVTTAAAMQTVGAFLVVAMLIIPGATAYLMCDRFGILLIYSASLGVISSTLGAYLSYFIDGATGGIIVLLQSVFFIITFFCAPKYGLLSHLIKRKHKI